MSVVRVHLNGETRELAARTRVGDLLRGLGRDPRTVAVERNGSILAREDYDRTTLVEGDRLEVVHFVQGG